MHAAFHLGIRIYKYSGEKTPGSGVCGPLPMHEMIAVKGV